MTNWNEAGQKRTPPTLHSGLIGTVATIAREEGASSLWKGLAPSLHRQVVYGGLRVALYDDVKKNMASLVGGGDTLAVKVAAGLTTGALAISECLCFFVCALGGWKVRKKKHQNPLNHPSSPSPTGVANPTDLVKVRMQAEGKLPPGAPRRYPSAVGVYKTIARTEGAAALWTGLGPNIGRNAIINAAELASYDAIKGALLGAGATDGVPVHLAAGLGAGFFAVVCGSPVDVVKSRIMGAFGVGGVGRVGEGARHTHTHTFHPPLLIPKTQ